MKRRERRAAGVGYQAILVDCQAFLAEGVSDFRALFGRRPLAEEAETTAFRHFSSAQVYGAPDISGDRFLLSRERQVIITRSAVLELNPREEEREFVIVVEGVGRIRRLEKASGEKSRGAERDLPLREERARAQGSSPSFRTFLCRPFFPPRTRERGSVT